MLKDLLLIEAALHTDEVIVSLDETVRGYFHAVAGIIPALTHIIWVNPCIDEETSIEWLQKGAEHDMERLLGHSR